MSKYFITFSILIFFQGCGKIEPFSLDNGVEPAFEGPISGHIFELGTYKPISEAKVMLMKNSNPGILSFPSYVTVATVRTDADGFFIFNHDNTQHMKLDVSYDGKYQIDEKSYFKYDDVSETLVFDKIKDINIALIPTAVLKVFFQSDVPLSENDKFSVTIAGHGSNFSNRNPVPSEQLYSCVGNKKFLIQWTIQRASSESKTYGEEISIPAFTKGNYVIKY